MENEVSTTTIPKSSEGITGWIESVIITTSQTSVGQTLFKLIDSFLWVVEKSAQWSLPSQEITAEENGKVFGKIELVRPLPWILFLPGLVILRIIRGGLNVGAYILGYPQIQPSTVVKFVQKHRRRLRALNLKAVKSARRKSFTKDKRLSMIEAKKALIRSIRLTLSTLSCLDTTKSSPSPPPTKIRICHMDLEPAVTPDEKSTTESVGSPIHHEMKRKFSQVSLDEEGTDESENETFHVKLERLAMSNSTDDPDFNPAECSTESSLASSENEVEKEVSLTELISIEEEAKEFYKNNEKALLQEANSKSDEDTVDGVKRVDSSEAEQKTKSSITKDFINGEINAASVSAPPPTVVVETSQTPEVTNGLVIEKQKPLKASTPLPEVCILPQAHSSVSKENYPNVHERKGKPRKFVRKDAK